MKLLVDSEQAVATAAAGSMAELKAPASAGVIHPLASRSHAFVRIGALRALKELRRKDSLEVAPDASRDTRRRADPGRWRSSAFSSSKRRCRR